jgi:beta-glucosidase
MNVDRFPPDFLWGTATAAHQVEGGNHLNDWWAWEQVPGHIRNGDRSDPACDHYRRFVDDFDLLKRLHQNAHRLSLEWSRIEPAPGHFAPEAIAHYAEVLQALRARGLRPLVTLHHFTNPTWIAKAGGWEAPETAERFAQYADRVMAELGGLADDWITINEPTVVAYQGFFKGEWPPGTRDLGATVRVLVTMLRAHWLAYERMKRRRGDIRIGLAHHLRIFDPARRFAPQDRVVAAAFQRVFNETVLRSLRQGRLAFPLTRAGRASGPAASQDFIGLNYYTRELIRFNRRYGAELFGQRIIRPNVPRSELDWEIYPQGLYRVLIGLRRERLPILITENGIADGSDALRPQFLIGHARAMLAAIREGVALKGYFHWTCFDNFEWAEGYSAKFGLIANDPAQQDRRLRQSARLYAEICRTGLVPVSAEPTPATAPEASSGEPADFH